jgi:hypothetical protein
MVAVVFFLTAAVLALVQARMRNQIRADLASTLRTQTRFYADIESVRREQAQQSASFIAHQPSVKALMSTNDRAHGARRFAVDSPSQPCRSSDSRNPSEMLWPYTQSQKT